MAYDNGEAVQELIQLVDTDGTTRTYRNPSHILLIDKDGIIHNEADYRELLDQIIRHNDVATLNRYLAKFPNHGIAPGEVYYDDPFYKAASRGSTDVLRVLLKHYNTLYNADPSQISDPLDQRGFQLLVVACQHAQLDTVLFLLDSQPPLGTVCAGDGYSNTALLAAASSVNQLRQPYFEPGTKPPSYDHQIWARNSIARSEELMHMLLDRGACARDVLMYRNGPLVLRETALGLAIPHASYRLVRRLIDEGADIHAKQYYCHDMTGFGRAEPEDVTALHIACLNWNMEGIRALLDHQRTASNDPDYNSVDLLACRDSNGCSPLHWAAAGPEPFDARIISDGAEVPPQVSLFELLLADNPGVINDLDKQGVTPLYYAVTCHIGCRSLHTFLAIQYLCSHGADASISDKRGRGLLHNIGYSSAYSKPIENALLDLLVENGADINRVDPTDGRTPLHIMTQTLRQVEGARHLIRLGADIHAKDSKGDTPLHKAARGFFPPCYGFGRVEEMPTVADKIQAQDEMFAAILDEAGGDESSDWMDQQNSSGETPRQLRENQRVKWREEEEARGKPRTRGGARGRGRGQP